MTLVSPVRLSFGVPRLGLIGICLFLVGCGVTTYPGGKGEINARIELIDRENKFSDGFEARTFLAELKHWKTPRGAVEVGEPTFTIVSQKHARSHLEAKIKFYVPEVAAAGDYSITISFYDGNNRPRAHLHAAISVKATKGAATTVDFFKQAGVFILMGLVLLGGMFVKFLLSGEVGASRCPSCRAANSLTEVSIGTQHFSGFGGTGYEESLVRTCTKCGAKWEVTKTVELG